MKNPLTMHITGRWAAGQVVCRWVESTRRIDPQVEREIEQAWAEAMRRPGIKLFDGPMCRLERWQADAPTLRLELSRTSYKAFLGTNMRPGPAGWQAGREVLASPLGVSCALETAEGSLLLGRRNQWVAYYPGRLHPFAGALEPSERPDVFAEMRRELAEELRLSAADITAMHCLGLVEDHTLRQPELILHARVNRPAGELAGDVDDHEHRGSVILAPQRGEVERMLQHGEITPVGVATLLLWGRERFGEQWFAEHGGR